MKIVYLLYILILKLGLGSSGRPAELSLKSCLPINDPIKKDNLISTWVVRPFAKQLDEELAVMISKFLAREKFHYINAFIMYSSELPLIQFSLVMGILGIIALIILKLITSKKIKKYYLKNKQGHSPPGPYLTRPGSICYPIAVCFFLIFPCLYGILTIMHSIADARLMTKDIVCTTITANEALTSGVSSVYTPKYQITAPWIGTTALKAITVNSVFEEFDNDVQQILQPVHTSLDSTLNEYITLKEEVSTLSKGLATFNHIPVEAEIILNSLEQPMKTLDEFNVNFEANTNISNIQEFKDLKKSALEAESHVNEFFTQIEKLGFFKNAVKVIVTEVVKALSIGMMILGFLNVVPGIFSFVIFMSIMMHYINKKALSKGLIKSVLCSTYIHGVFIIFLFAILILLVIAGASIRTGCSFFENNLIQKGEWKSVYSKGDIKYVNAAQQCVTEKKAFASAFGIENIFDDVIDGISKTGDEIVQSLNLGDLNSQNTKDLLSKANYVILYDIKGLKNVNSIDSLKLSGVQKNDIVLDCSNISEDLKTNCVANQVTVKGVKTLINEFNQLTNQKWCIPQTGCEPTETPIDTKTTVAKLLGGNNVVPDTVESDIAIAILDKFKVLSFTGFSCGHNVSCNLENVMIDTINGYIPKKVNRLVQQSTTFDFSNIKDKLVVAARNNKQLNKLIDIYFNNTGFCNLVHDVAYTGVTKTCNMVTEPLTRIIQACLIFCGAAVMLFFISFTVWVFAQS